MQKVGVQTTPVLAGLRSAAVAMAVATAALVLWALPAAACVLPNGDPCPTATTTKAASPTTTKATSPTTTAASPTTRADDGDPDDEDPDDEDPGGHGAPTTKAPKPPTTRSYAPSTTDPRVQPFVPPASGPAPPPPTRPAAPVIPPPAPPDAAAASSGALPLAQVTADPAELGSAPAASASDASLVVDVSGDAASPSSGRARQVGGAAAMAVAGLVLGTVITAATGVAIGAMAGAVVLTLLADGALAAAGAGLFFLGAGLLMAKMFLPGPGQRLVPMGSPSSSRPPSG